ncbi:MAG: hypothetical protein ACLQBK_14695 [Candidatus Sulfotelmatobacter sp.]
MTLVIILVIAAAVSLAVILGVAVSRSLKISAEGSLASQIRPLDVEAFRNLADPAEDAYLRQRLPASEFRVVRRARLRALAVYVQTAGKNAAVLARIGQETLASSDAATVEAARELVNQALLLRRNAALALLKTYVAMAWPNSMLGAGPILDGYRQLSGAAMLLGRLQNPAAPVRI